ncbi:MAG: ribbon-helix-helix protein, CopG family [Bradyrhizobiaceae bacterium]|jgi:predicted transcriptional regulator|nr:MAG: ribbon-helix-helix protein, CopG family [Bradyrhizobiaceae bacterium]
MFPKHSAISIRVTDDVKSAVEKAARARRLSVTAMISDLLIAHLKKTGYLRDSENLTEKRVSDSKGS